MTYQKNMKGYDTALGFIVTLSMTSDTRARVVAKGLIPRREITIHLPDSKQERWATIFQDAIMALEKGDRWTVRLDWENVRQFFSMDDLKKIERAIKMIPICVYNAPAFTNTTKLDCNALYNAKLRDKYHQTKNNA